MISIADSAAPSLIEACAAGANGNSPQAGILTNIDVLSYLLALCVLV